LLIVLDKCCLLQIQKFKCDGSRKARSSLSCIMYGVEEGGEMEPCPHTTLASCLGQPRRMCSVRLQNEKRTDRQLCLGIFSNSFSLIIAATIHRKWHFSFNSCLCCCALRKKGLQVKNTPMMTVHKCLCVYFQVLA
jgi:hypothetical protein